MESTSPKRSDPSRTSGSPDDPIAADRIQSTVEEVLAAAQFIDMHTHLFPPAFGRLGLWGIDELLT
jgi:hypothetical protein